MDGVFAPYALRLNYPFARTISKKQLGKYAFAEGYLG